MQRSWIAHRLKFKGYQKSTFRWKFSELGTRTLGTSTIVVSFSNDDNDNDDDDDDDYDYVGDSVRLLCPPSLFSDSFQLLSHGRLVVEGKLLDNFCHGRASLVLETFLKRRVAGIVRTTQQQQQQQQLLLLLSPLLRARRVHRGTQ